ncbi:MAG: ABC-type uncharacterized transport system permease subunit [Planctomycetota bacterium]|jgi:ABC-type uncharacterized transport system permease subunit
MNTTIQALAVFLPCGYLWVALLYGMAFAGEHQPRIAKARGSSALILIGMHLLYFVLFGIGTNSLPLSNTWLMISSIVWTTCVLSLILSGRLHHATVGCFLFFLGGILQMLASAFGPITLEEAGSGYGSTQLLHGLTSILASSALLLSGIYGWLHLMLYRQMRAKRFGLLFRQLPDLEKLSRLTRRSALAGFLMLTLGVNIGIGVGHASREGGFSYLDPHVLLSIFVWLHFGAIAFSERIRGISARRASFAAVAGMLTLIALLLLSLVPGITDHTAGL